MAIRFQHYEVPQRPDGSPWELGRGAMGVTYKAFDTNLRSPAALKVINSAYLANDNARQRFLREARAAAQLRHPNVATIFHLGHEGVENYFYAMELIEGETFEELIARGGPLTASDALELTLQVTRALIAAHGVGLIHRDIKPSNLMLTRQHGEPLVKVIDFGLAKAIGPDGDTGSGDSTGSGAALTKTSGGFVGTPFFASPEQLENLALDTRSDIYSLGITLWYLISGVPPFNATSLARVMSEHLSKPPPFERLLNQPECIVRLLRRMLEKNPVQRPQTPMDLRDEIFACLRELPPSNLTDRAGAQGAAAAAGGDPGATLMQTQPIPISATCEIGPLNLGATLDARFRLDERASTATFRGTDLTNGESVAVRPLPTSSMQNVTAAMAPWRAAAAACPSVLRPAGAGITADGTGYVALEWVTGTATLLDLMRQRGALTVGEVLALLEPMAAADMELQRQGLSGAHLEPSRILLPPPAVDGEPGFFPRLAPAEIFPETSASSRKGDETMLAPTSTAVPSLASGGDPRAFGRLACELLGGPARNWLEPDAAKYTPLSSLNEAGNVMLRRCLTSSAVAGGDGYPNGVEFVAALRRSVEGVVGFSHPLSSTQTPLRPGTNAPLQPGTNAPGRSTTLTAKPLSGSTVTAAAGSATSGPKAAPAGQGGGFGVMLGLLALLLVAVGIGVGVWMLRGKPSDTVITTMRENPAAAATPASGPSAPAKPRSSSVSPLVTGKAWTNSLGMNFVPLAAEAKTLHVGVWPVRLADFTAFIDATNYDASGGMYSVGADGKRRQLGRTWKDPGFVQDPMHPVVGVNIADAEAFCAWLTKAERESGALPAGRRYRLPTDEEWSRLAGLKNESATATPEQRGEKSTDVFPWGTTWPPPSRAGNYAGVEAGLPPTETIAGYNDGFPRTSPAGTFPVNAIGLYDMSGNVWQWCSDRFKADSNWRVVRGGSWLTAARAQLRLGARQGYNPEFRHDDIGFRCVIAPEN